VAGRTLGSCCLFLFWNNIIFIWIALLVELSTTKTWQNNKLLVVAFAFSSYCVWSFDGLLINTDTCTSQVMWMTIGTHRPGLYVYTIVIWDEALSIRNWSLCWPKLVNNTHTGLSGLSLLRLIDPDFLLSITFWNNNLEWTRHATSSSF
jgi:hypothetical protein